MQALQKRNIERGILIAKEGKAVQRPNLWYWKEKEPT